MATTSNRLTDLYREALDSVTATPENWLRFLQSAGRNYRYPFQNQLLIHYQRPDAIAVLEFSQWERRFHRGIRRGSTGIAVFGRSNGRTQVRYLFDIQDTNERSNSIPVPLWNVETGDHGPLLHMLEQKFSATEPVLPIAVMTAAKQYTSAVVSLRWEELQKAQVPVTQDALERLVENSVAYLLLFRMGLEDYAIFYPQDFDALEQFRTPQNIHLLGDIVNMASRDILTEVAATVRAEHLGQPTFFAEETKTVYDEPTKEQSTHEGGQNHDDDLSHRERLEPSESDTAPGDTRNRKIRPDAEAVPDRAPAQPVPDPADQRDTEPAPDGSAEASGGNAGAGYEENAPAGASEAREPHGVDRPDEQPEAQHRGNDLPDADYQLNIFGDTQEPEQSGSFVRKEPSRVDEMLQQAELAAELSQGTGQNLFAFEAGNPEPVNLPHETNSAEPSTVSEPEPSVPAANFRITDDNLGCGSIRQKFANNLSAIRLLKSLEEDGRNATPEEQEILSRYVGWGGMPQAFDPENTSWSSEYTQLKELLEAEEYKAARESVLNAHYTSPTVIRGIYEAIGRMGFTSGNILEPACGVGNFFGMLPDRMSGSRLYGVELDSISGRIAKQLYPNADITVAGFETTDRRNFYDLAIGNVPFGNYLVDDKSYNSLGFRIHNYFLAKALDQVRPGGVVAFVTSRYTMDSKSTEVRKYLAQRAELLGAIRLPNNAFLANAGTSVVSDILFLQKRQRMVAMEPEWVHLDKTEDGITLNRYFVQHPEMVLGELTTESTQYGKEECTVRPIPGAVLSQQLHEAVQHICGTYVEMELDEAQDELEDSIPADPNVKNYMVHPFEINIVENSMRTVAICLAIYSLAVGIALSSRKNTRNGEEHGSAKWGNPKSICRRYRERQYSQNILLTQKVRLGLDSHRHRRNLNVLVVGGSGAGKTRFYCKPNLLQANTSFVVLDPKGELTRDTGNLLQAMGYEVRVLDLIHMEKSHCYNPFQYIENDNDAQRLVTNLFKATTPKGSSTSDPFWDTAAQMLLMALVLYLVHEAPPQEQNFAMVMELLAAGDVKEDNESYQSPLDILFQQLSAREPEHIAVKYYLNYRSGAAKTLKSIQIIQVWSAEEGQQRFDTHVDKLMNYIRYWQASGESLKTSIRTSTRLRQLTEEGHYTGGSVPFGYTLVEKGRINKRGKAVFDLAINPSEAEIVQFIFDLYANEGYGSQRISHYLFHKGVIGRSGTNIPNTTINRILKNVMYTGVIKNGPARSEPIEELRIIPDDLFNRTQQIMVSRRQHRNEVPLNSAGSSLLVGRVFCGHCGNRLTLTTSGKAYVRKNGSVYHQTKVRYQCHYKVRHPGDCDGQSGYGQKKLDGIVDEVIRQQLNQLKACSKADLLSQRHQKELSLSQAKCMAAEKALQRSQQDVDDLRHETLKVIRGTSKFSQELLSSLLDEATEKAQEAQAQLESYQKEYQSLLESSSGLEQEYHQILSWADLYDHCSISKKKMIVSQLINAVYVRRDYEITVEFNISFDDFHTLQYHEKAAP